MKHGKNLVVLAGRAHRRTEADGRRSAHYFSADNAMLARMQFLVDVENADATMAADKEMILGEIRARPGGTAAMDERIRAGLQTAHELSKLDSVEAASAIAAFLIGEPARLAALGADAKATGLRGSASAGQAAAVRGLLAVEAGTEAMDADGKTGLVLAAEKGHMEVVKALLAAGADVGAKDEEWGMTALIWAAAQGHAEVVEALLAAGADIEAKDKLWGETALIKVAATEGQQPPSRGRAEVAGLLLVAGADVGATDQEGMTALLLVARNGDAEVAGLLLAAGADVEATAVGNTALMLAAENGFTDVARLRQDRAGLCRAPHRGGRAAGSIRRACPSQLCRRRSGCPDGGAGRPHSGDRNSGRRRIRAGQTSGKRPAHPPRRSVCAEGGDP